MFVFCRLLLLSSLSISEKVCSSLLQVATGGGTAAEAAEQQRAEEDGAEEEEVSLHNSSFVFMG